VLEDGTFTPRKLQRTVSHPHVAANGIEQNIANPQSYAKSPSWSAEQGLCAGDQLCHIERLYQIVVCAHVKAADTLLNRVTRPR
jgi:hypothetical protein